MLYSKIYTFISHLRQTSPYFKCCTHFIRHGKYNSIQCMFLPPLLKHAVTPQGATRAWWIVSPSPDWPDTVHIMCPCA